MVIKQNNMSQKNYFNFQVIVVFLFVINTSYSQNDTIRSNYNNESGFGGPKTIGAQLEYENKQKEPYYRVPIKVFKSWYDFKNKLNEQTGIQFGLNYTSAYIGSSAVINEDVNDKTTGSGILDLQLGWNAVGRKSGKNKGTLFAKLNSRHSYGNGTPPMFHGVAESGYYGLPATGYNDYSFRFLELNWQQSLANNHVHFVFGKVDPTNYFNFHSLIVPWQHFLGYGASVSGTVNWPNQGLGVIASYNTGKFFVMAGLTDAYGDTFTKGKPLEFGENFFDGNFFKAIEVGYVPSFEERFFKKISLMYWNTDSYVNPTGSEISSGEGIAFSVNWYFKEKFIPYFRLAFSDGNGENAFYKRDIQVGHGYRFSSHDILGFALSFAEPNIPDTKDQTTIELFYRFDITEHLSLTPDTQLIFNPTLNPNENTIFYWGFRGRVTF